MKKNLSFFFLSKIINRELHLIHCFDLKFSFNSNEKQRIISSFIIQSFYSLDKYDKQDVNKKEKKNEKDLLSLSSVIFLIRLLY